MDYDRFLHSLTIKEFRELSLSIANEVSHQISQSHTVEQEDPRETIFIADVAVLTGYTQATIYSKVSRGEIPVMSHGRPLTFSKTDILDWIKSGKPSNAEKLAKEKHSKFSSL